MKDADFLPNDLAPCQRLLLAAFREATEQERRLADAERRANESQQQATDRDRVLDETAVSFAQLRDEHAATSEERVRSAVHSWDGGRGLRGGARSLAAHAGHGGCPEASKLKSSRASRLARFGSGRLVGGVWHPLL